MHLYKKLQNFGLTHLPFTVNSVTSSTILVVPGPILLPALSPSLLVQAPVTALVGVTLPPLFSVPEVDRGRRTTRPSVILTKDGPVGRSRRPHPCRLRFRLVPSPHPSRPVSAWDLYTPGWVGRPCRSIRVRLGTGHDGPSKVAVQD